MKKEKVMKIVLGKDACSLQKKITDLICYSSENQRIFTLAKSINPSIPKAIGFCAATIHCLIDDGVLKLKEAK